MSAALWLGRARSAMGSNTLYWAGAGGHNAGTSHPGSPFLMVDLSRFDESTRLSVPLASAAVLNGHGIDYSRGALKVRACDCSGFVCWVLGFARTTTQPPWSRNGEVFWINTDAIWRDAAADGAHARFVLLPSAAVGCLAVYPKPDDGSEPFGHVAFVSAVGADGKPERFIHCSGENYRSHLDAIQENYTDAFLHRAASTRYVWPKGVPLPA
jgi:hypothetical protein